MAVYLASQYLLHVSESYLGDSAEDIILLDLPVAESD